MGAAAWSENEAEPREQCVTRQSLVTRIMSHRDTPFRLRRQLEHIRHEKPHRVYAN